ncbi:MAG: hypothetical protein AAF849_10125 [Bacteroidota bacterium]
MIIRYLIFCKNRASKIKTYSDYQLTIVDSIMIDYAGMLKYVDYLPDEKTHLLVDISERVVIEADAKGKIIHQFNCGGKEENKIGTSLSAIGYVDSATVGIVSEKGIFLFKRDGQLERFIKSPVKFLNPVYQYLFAYKDSEHDYLIYDCDPFYDFTEKLFMPGQEGYYEAYKALTLFDMKGERKSLNYGI